MGNTFEIEIRCAIHSNDLETIKSLISKGYKVNNLYPELGLIYVGAPKLMWTYQTTDEDPFGGRDNYFPLVYYNPLILAKIMFSDYKIKWSALMYAACLGRIEVIEMLLENGANKNLKDEADQTAYDIALKMKRKESIFKLLSI